MVERAERGGAVSHVKAMAERAALAGSTSIIPLLLKRRNESVKPTATENYRKSLRASERATALQSRVAS